MSSALQEVLSSLRRVSHDPLWSGKPNEWLKNLGARDTADVAELLVLRIFNGERARDKDAGYKVETADARIEIKLATLGQMGPGLAFMWQRVQISDSFTHLS